VIIIDLSHPKITEKNYWKDNEGGGGKEEKREQEKEATLSQGKDIGKMLVSEKWAGTKSNLRRSAHTDTSSGGK